MRSNLTAAEAGAAASRRVSREAQARRGMRRIVGRASQRGRRAVTGAMAGKLILATALAAVLAATPAQAVEVGIADQHAGTFSDPAFRSLALRYARIVVPWDVGTTDPAPLDAWLSAARAAGARPLVAFGVDRRQRCPVAPCTPPRAEQSEAAVGAFCARWPWVADLGVWNEPNLDTQPTSFSPALVTRYWQAATPICPSCKVVAAEVLDSTDAPSYLRAMLAAAPAAPRLWGIHPHEDANHFRSSGTAAILRTVPGEVWFTEASGLVRYTTAEGRTTFRYDEERGARALQHAFELAGGRVTRVYVYSWRAQTTRERFDSALLNADGSARPGLAVVRAQLRPKLKITSARLAGRRLRVRLDCVSRRCTGTLRIRNGPRSLGRKRFSVGAGATRRISVALKLRRGKPVRLRLSAKPTGGTTATRSLTVRRR